MTYEEYLRRSGATTGRDQRISRADWDAMTPADRYQILRRQGDHTGGFGSVYGSAADAEAFRAKFGEAPWAPVASGRPETRGQYVTGYGNIREHGAEGTEEASEYAIDPSRVMYLPDGRWIMEADNVNGDWLAKSQSKRSDKSNRNKLIAATIVGGGALAGAMGVGAPGAGMAESAAFAPNAAGIGAAGGGAAELASMAGLEGMGGVGSMGAGLGAGGGGLAGALGGAGSAVSSALGGLGIRDVVRAGLGLFALGQMNKDRGGGGGGGGGVGSNAQSIIDQMANANRVDINTPLGSRKWNKGEDGRWSVTDSMDPAEEQNFRGVQGMNSDVTGMARQRLAELLANPKKSRGVSYGMFNIGG